MRSNPDGQRNVAEVRSTRVRRGRRRWAPTRPCSNPNCPHITSRRRMRPVGAHATSKKLIAGATYGPAQLKVISDAFEAAWDDVKVDYRSPLAVQAARLKLANMSSAWRGGREA